MASVKIAAAFAFCARSYYNFLHTCNKKNKNKKPCEKGDGG